MKIMMVMHTFNNFGGIINHCEHLMAGLKEIGHEVTFAYLKPNKQVKSVEIPATLKEGYEIGIGSGYPVHQGDGWIAPYYSYKVKESIDQFVTDANKHDIVIWQSIFGFKNKDTEHDLDWLPMIEKITAKQVPIIHDANLKKLYPWIQLFEKHFSGLACVHPAAYESADFMNVPRALILNPQDIAGVPETPPFAGRENKLLSIQTFKRWKRVDDLIRSVPYMPTVKTLVGGYGIEAAYMMSKDKCKEEYYATKEYDPDVSEDRQGKRIWENAENSGNFEYLGFISGGKRDEILATSKFLVDPSWSNTFGEHFNRVVIDAMRIGTVPIAINYGVSNNEEGMGVVLKAGINYCMIKKSSTPKQYGEAITNFCNMSETDYRQIQLNNYELIKQFDRKVIAQHYVDLANQKPTGYLTELKTKTNHDPSIPSKAQEMFDAHFEVKQEVDLESLFG
jgi:glycosyltransferase involved in cell wall biosynthesis